MRSARGSHVLLIRPTHRKRGQMIQIAQVCRLDAPRSGAGGVGGLDVITQRGRWTVFPASDIDSVAGERVGEHSLPDCVLLSGELECPLRRQPPIPRQIPRLVVHPQHGRGRQGEPNLHLGVAEPLTRQAIQRHISADLIQGPVVAGGLDLPGECPHSIMRQLGPLDVTHDREQPSAVVEVFMDHLPCRRFRCRTRRGRRRIRQVHCPPQPVTELPRVQPTLPVRRSPPPPEPRPHPTRLQWPQRSAAPCTRRSPQRATP